MHQPMGTLTNGEVARVHVIQMFSYCEAEREVSPQGSDIRVKVSVASCMSCSNIRSEDLNESTLGCKQN